MTYTVNRATFTYTLNSNGYRVTCECGHDLGYFDTLEQSKGYALAHTYTNDCYTRRNS